ncbi:Transient receptor potential cation channel subfamily A member 1 [Pleurostoma richardsiae]|uniref:Transient receptor potential cation channel subfamily A member 1 n=1 Tax=Pleurostoma richardsiae TaxID=41990 RepID=A0AA38VHD3_9PEZI|nr:Transient receptor potential cation channel subfamily A member 1 [Pleurostoma richardsiae]
MGAQQKNAAPAKATATVVASTSKCDMPPTSKSLAGRNSSTPPFTELPTELVILIANLLQQPDQASLASTSRFFHHIVNPIIYTNDIRHNGSSCVYWGTEQGVLGTLKHALTYGADLNGPLKSDKSDNDDPPTTDEPASVDGSVDADGDDDTAAASTTADTDKKRRPFSTALHVAAKNGHRDVAEWLLDNGVDINARSWKYCDCLRMHWRRYFTRPARPFWRPLYAALNHDHTSVAELLIFRGAKLDNLHTNDEKRITALQVAAANGLVSTVKLLALDIDLDINERDFRDNTALHYAAQFWGTDTEDLFATSAIPKLLCLGADIEAMNVEGHTPLLHACWMGNFRAANILLKAGANPDPHHFMPDFTDVRPLYYACLSRGKILQLCSRVPRQANEEWEDARIELLRALTNAGADTEGRLNKNGRRGGTPLMFAAAYAGCRAVQVLLEAGADVNAQDARGETPMLVWMRESELPAEDECPMTVTSLVSHGANFSLADQDGIDPLRWAVNRYGPSGDEKSSKKFALKLMLEKATEANVSLIRLRQAMAACSLSGQGEQLQLILDCAQRLYGVTRTDLCECFDGMLQQSDRARQCETFDVLMDFASSIGVRIESNEALLMRMFEAKNKELSLAVLRRGVAIAEGPHLWERKTLLHVAALWGDIDVAEALLERGADVNAFDNELRTPLMIAVVDHNKELSRALMREVADPHLVPSDELLARLYPDEANDDGPEAAESERRCIKSMFRTAFDLAINYTCYDILADMVTHFALPPLSPRWLRDSYVVRGCRNHSIAELLLSHGADPDGGNPRTGTPLLRLLRFLAEGEDCPADLAARKLRVARLFVRYGADPNLRDGKGRSAIEVLRGLLEPDAGDGCVVSERQREMADIVGRELALVEDGPGKWVIKEKVGGEVVDVAKKVEIVD